MRVVVLLVLAAACTPSEVPGDAVMGDGGRAAGAGAQPEGWRAVTVCPTGATVPGMDVSKWQGTIDWGRASGDVDFAFIRVSDGLYYYDNEFARNWSEAKANGVARGVYQFFRPSLDPVDQADLLLNSMGPLEPGDLPPVIDVEVSDGQSASVIIDGVQQWIDRVESETGVKPLIYTSYGLWSSLTGDTAQFSDYPLWIANWGVSCPTVPNAWGAWDVWQTSATGSVSGIGGDVDLNVFNGDLAALDDYGFDDPVPCDTVPAAGRIIEETESCFYAGGPSAYWRVVNDGSGGSLLYTHATDFANVENYGVWSFEVDVDGEYLLEVYTAAPHAESELAAYEVAHADGTDWIVVDQTAVDGWNSVGTFWFDAGTAPYVRLDDNTGEPWNNGDIQLVYDAIRLTPVGGGTTTGTTDTGTGSTGNSTDDPPTTDTEPTDTLEVPTRPSVQPAALAPEPKGGCGCSSSGASGWMALLALPVLSRRRG